MAMVSDPCNSTLVPGLYGDQEGMLARVRQTIFDRGTPTNTCGYVLWAQDYHCMPNSGAAAVGPANLFTWTSSDPGLVPANTTVNPFGSATDPFQAAMVTAHAANDPAGQLLQRDIVQSARTLSACLQMTYTGRMADSSGEFCFIEALPASALAGNDTIGGDPVSVNQLFNYSTKYERLGTDTVENICRPDDLGEIFRGPELGVIDVNTPGTISPSLIEAKIQAPTFFGVAWRGLDTADASPLSFILTKNIEWKPAPLSGLAHAPPRQINNTSVAHKTTNALDMYMPNWATRVMSSSSSAAANLAQTAFTGVAGAIGNAARPIAQRYAAGIGTSILDGLADVGAGALMLL